MTEAASQSPLHGVNERLVIFTALFFFLLASAVTIHFSRTMVGGMEMPGGWTMSMMWMRMPGQPWGSVAVMFVAMWQSMMVAMMLPSALPMILIYRRAVIFRGERHVASATWMVVAGYFLSWLVFGLVSYAGGMGINQVAMVSENFSRKVPQLSGALLVAAGLYQLTPWKSGCLKRCQDPLSLLSRWFPRSHFQMLKLGVVHGLYCAGCCWALMILQMVLGAMNLAVMAGIALVILLEKTLPHGLIVARFVGGFVFAGGLWLLA